MLRNTVKWCISSKSCFRICWYVTLIGSWLTLRLSSELWIWFAYCCVLIDPKKLTTRERKQCSSGVICLLFLSICIRTMITFRMEIFFCGNDYCDNILKGLELDLHIAVFWKAVELEIWNHLDLLGKSMGKVKCNLKLRQSWNKLRKWNLHSWVLLTTATILHVMIFIWPICTLLFFCSFTGEFRKPGGEGR